MGADRLILLTGRGEIRIYDGGAANYTSIKSAASLAASRSFVLPNTVGSAGQFLQTDGAGNLSWGSAAGVSLDAAYDGGSAITVDTGAITFNVTTNINGLRIAKTGSGAGSPLSIDNDGTGSAIDVVQDGVGVAIDADRPTGGQIGRFRATASGDPYVGVSSQTGREARIGVDNAGNIFLGSGSNHSVEFRINNVEKWRIDTSGDLSQIGANGQSLVVHSVTESTNLSGATTDTSGALIPAGCLLLGVVCRVTTTETGCTSILVGVNGATSRFHSGMNVTAGSTTDSGVNGNEVNPRIYPGTAQVRFSAVGGAASFVSGVVRTTSYFAQLNAHTS